MTTTAKPHDIDLTESAVAAWLEQHPAFFQNRDHLLLKMTLPHAHSTNNGEAISLVERQVSLLRQRNMDTRRQLDELMESAKRNDQIFQKSQTLVLSLLAAKDSNGFFKALEASFKRDFGSNAYSLIIFSARANQINHFTSSIPAESATAAIGNLMNAKAPFLGVPTQAEREFLFGDASGDVKSAAVLGLNNKQEFALLAIGNSDVGYFKAGMGTMFIRFIADVLALLLPRYVDVDSQ